MGILVLINITACLALIDIALKSTIEGYMTQKMCIRDRAYIEGTGGPLIQLRGQSVPLLS